MGRLQDKVAVITGGARGMGASHVRKFIEEGAKVIFTDIRVELGEELERELGNNAKFLQHDVTKEEDWTRVVDEAESTFGAINILVNNAGVDFDSSIENTTEKDYRRVIDINQVSVFLGMKHTLESMRKSGSGSIVNISSMAGIKVFPHRVAYAASKFAVRGMTKVAALEFAEYGIRVNSVHPGIINTPILGVSEGSEILEQTAQTIPLKRIANSEEVSNLVLFLASDESSYSTGAEFLIDGGSTL